MNTNMYNNLILKENLAKLEKLGYIIVSPTSGKLACNDIGIGKLISEEQILDSIKPKKKNIKILIIAGPTREYMIQLDIYQTIPQD